MDEAAARGGEDSQHAVRLLSRDEAGTHEGRNGKKEREGGGRRGEVQGGRASAKEPSRPPARRARRGSHKSHARPPPRVTQRSAVVLRGASYMAEGRGSRALKEAGLREAVGVPGLARKDGIGAE